MTIVKYKKTELIISIILCGTGILIALGALFYASLSYKIVAMIWFVIIFHLLIFSLKQFSQFKNGIPAIIIDENGITNNTSVKTIFIPWSDIKQFKTGFYRTNSIYIEPKNLDKYKPVKIKDYLDVIRYINSFTTVNADLLWIEIDMMDIKKEKLMYLLNDKLYLYK